MSQEFTKISAERNSVNEELNELLNEKAEKDVIIKTLTKENLELNSKITSLEQLLIVKEDLSLKLDQVSQAHRRLNANKEKYKGDLEICTSYLLEVEEKCQEAQKTSLELLQ